MTFAQVVETSVTNNCSFQNYPHPDDHTIRTTDTPGFKPFTMPSYVYLNIYLLLFAYIGPEEPQRGVANYVYTSTHISFSGENVGNISL